STASIAGTRGRTASATGMRAGGSSPARTGICAARGIWSSAAMAVEAIERAPRSPGLFGRIGARVLDVLQIFCEAAVLFVASVRLVPAALVDRGRVAAQMVRVGTETLWIGALLSFFVGMVLVVQAADQVR